MTGPDPLVHRAASILRSTPEPGWDAISDDVLAAVRNTPRRGWPLHADTPPGPPPGGAVFVSDHVLRSTIAAHLRRAYLCVPTAIDVHVDGHRLRALSIDITGSYGAHLHTLADQIRTTTADIIDELFGTHGADARTSIDITITDIVTGDPLDPPPPAPDNTRQPP